MRRIACLLALGLLALTGCVLIDHGGDLPPDYINADARFYDPFDGINHPLLSDNMRRQ